MEKRTFIAIFGIVLFMIAIYAYSLQCKAEISGSCPVSDRAREIADMLPLIGGVGILVGLAVYFFLDKRREEETERGKEVLEVLMQFLKPEEKKVLTYLLESGGKCYQSEISRLEGMGKLRAHRTLKKLEKQGILKREKLGKTSIVKLDESIFHFLKSST